MRNVCLKRIKRPRSAPYMSPLEIFASPIETMIRNRATSCRSLKFSSWNNREKTKGEESRSMRLAIHSP